jgi:hypothetical protein
VDAITARAGTAVKVNYLAGTAGLGALPEMQADFTAAFYASAEPSGAAVVTRSDAAVDLAKFPPPVQLVPAGGRGRGVAAPRVPWSARWTAILTPSVAGRYRFSLTGSGTAQLYLDRNKARIYAAGPRFQPPAWYAAARPRNRCRASENGEGS